MMTLRAALFALIWIGLMAGAKADPTPIRLAVISTVETADLAALVTTELSSNPDISLLERDDLSKIGDEAKLQQMAGSDAVGLGKLIGADGLLFMSKGPKGLQIRFTAVGLGYALFDDQLAAETDLPQLAKSLGHRVGDYAPKLKLSPAQAIPISVLNLRADTASEYSDKIERSLTLLLESSLASQPEYVVLERRHVWSLNFERSLSDVSEPLLHGTYVVDGTISLLYQGASDVAVHLRLRSPNDQETPLEIQGSLSDLPRLVEQMTAEIRKATGVSGSSAPWRPQKEAREYLLEGIWGWRHHANEAALEALDSAEILGETAPDLLAARIPVLCATVVVGSPDNLYPNPTIPDDPHPEARIDALRRAMTDETHYERGKMEAKLQILDDAHSTDGQTAELRSGIDEVASSLLVMLDRTNNPQTDDVRSAFASFAGYDPLHGKLPEDSITAIEYADAWSASVDEEVAYYRALVTTYPSAAVRGQWYLHQHLDPDTFCARFIPDDETRRQAYFDFLRSLLDDPVGKPTGLLDLAIWADPDQKEAACHNLYDELWAERDDLLKTNRICFFVGEAFNLEKERGVSVADSRVIALLHYVLQGVNQSYAKVNTTWHPELFPPDEAPSLWKDLEDLQTRSGGQVIYFSRLRQQYVERFGDPDRSESPTVPLVVNQFWYPKDAPGPFSLASYGLYAVSDGVWVAGSYAGPPFQAALYHVVIDPSVSDPLTTDPPIEPSTPIDPQAMAVTPEALYVLGSPPGLWQKSIMARFDFASSQWDEHEVPAASLIFQAAGQLYLSLMGQGLAFESGIARYNGETGETTLLASSRRRPAQNQFDDRDHYDVRSIFTGPGGKPCVTIGFGQSFYIEEQPGPWPRVIPSDQLSLAQTEGTRTLLYGNQTSKTKTNGPVAFMIDPAKANPELWLGAPAPFLGTGMIGALEAPLSAQPAWSQHPIWPDEKETEFTPDDFGFRGDDLFCCAIEKQTLKKVLIWYRRGQPDPIHIPLSFEMNNHDADALKDVLSDRDLQMFHDSPVIAWITVVPQGICYEAPAEGFWFLPFTDIDTYLKTNAGPRSQPQPPGTAPSTPPVPAN